MKKLKLVNYWKELWLKQDYIEKIIQKEADKTSSQLFLLEDIDEKYVESIKLSFNKVKKWEPIEYILNNAEFYWLDFYVDFRVLIPRNDTEVMVREVIKTINFPQARVESNNSEQGGLTYIDVWTWSWCIPISVVKNIVWNIYNCYAIEIWETALEVAKINVEKHNLQEKIKLIRWDLLEPILNTKDYQLSKNVVITANLPYIKTGDYKNMDSEVIFYEPDLALYWGKKTGFELYEKIINQCLELKNKGFSIILFIEIWYDQYPISKSYIEKLLLSYKYFKDNSGMERCMRIEF